MKSFFAQLVDWATNSYAFQAVVMSVLIAIMRVLYDNNETTWRRILLEAALCGNLTLAGYYALLWWKLPPQAAIVVGAALAFIGIEEMRKIVRALARKQLGVENDVQQ